MIDVRRVAMRKIAIRFIEWYQRVTRGRAPTCRYRPTCSNYAKEAFQTRSFPVALWLSLTRIIRCNPLSKGGYDPVPRKHRLKEPKTMDYLDIELEAQDEKTHKLRDYLGQKIVLYFYPKDNTSGCTLEAKAFTDAKDEFIKRGAVVIGVSKDSAKSHQNFCAKHDLDLILLSDPEGKLIEAFDVWKQKKMYGKSFFGIERSTFILDEEGKTIKSFRKVKVKDHAAEVIEALEA